MSKHPAPPMKKHTINDIAKISGTSPSTVSRVLTGAVPVAPEKREAILRAISDMSYRPNLLARSLRTKSTRSIGLLINDVLNPFYGALSRGAEDRLNEDGYAVIFCNTNEDPSKELSYLRMLQDKGVNGIILVPTGANKQALEELILGGKALVQVDRAVPGLDASSITVDNEEAGKVVAKHLLSSGHQRIGFVTYALGQSTVTRRAAGYVQALREQGIAPAENWNCPIAFDLSDATRSISRLLQGDQPPTAIIAANNRLGLAVLRTLKELKRTLSRDIALVIFDDLDIFDLFNPPISAVALPAYEMGWQAATSLLKQIQSSVPIASRHTTLQAELVIRSSSTITPLLGSSSAMGV